MVYSSCSYSNFIDKLQERNPGKDVKEWFTYHSDEGDGAYYTASIVKSAFDKSLSEMSIGEQKIYIFTDNDYLALFYWIEKNKDKSYLDQAYDIITLLSNQTKKIPLAKFKYKPISFDLKGLLDWQIF